MLKKALDSFAAKISRRLEKSRFVRRSLKVSVERVIEGLYLLALLILLGGGVNAVLEGLRFKAPQSMIFRSSTAQSIGDTVIYIFTLILGVAGVYFIYRGSRFTSSKRVSNFYLFVGVVGLLLALVIELYLFGYKRYG
ncbi:MAG: hypothetical protein HA494_05880 [Thaumarchaeota archaeon]|nr:hypothetical protein [Nitrososphaerota archaeon]